MEGKHARPFSLTLLRRSEASASRRQVASAVAASAVAVSTVAASAVTVKTVAAALVLVSAMVASPAVAHQPHEDCDPFIAFEQRFTVRNPDAIEIARLTGEDASVFIHAFNAMPPESDFDGDFVVGYLSARPDREGERFIVIVREGCLVYATAGPETYWLAPMIAVLRARDLSTSSRRGLHPEPVEGLRATSVAAMPVQTLCGDRADVLAGLKQSHSEEPVAIGLTSTGAVIEVLTSPSGTWTFLVTYPGGMTCMVATGDGWESLPARQGADGEPA